MSELITNYNSNQFFQREYTIKCKCCKKLYKSENSEYLYESDDRFRGLCEDCYHKKLNETFTDKDVLNFAKWSIDNTKETDLKYRQHIDVDDSIWKEKVVPKINELVQKEKEEKEKQYHKQKLDEAIKLIYSGCTTQDSKTPSVSITLFEKTIAKILEKFDELENQKHNDIWNTKFCI